MQGRTSICELLIVGLLATTLSLRAEGRKKLVQAPPATAAATAAAATPATTPTPMPTAPPTPKPRLTLERGASGSQLPFWRKDPELMRKMADDRAIHVSVKQAKGSQNPDHVRFTMLGAGYVSRSKETAFQLAQDYPRLKEVSSHFKTVQWDPNSSQLFVITEALGYQARMILKVVPVSEDWRSELQWEVVWGHFKGMTGVFAFEKVDSFRTEVSIQSIYEAAELPIPRPLVGVIMETITRKVAENMRKFLESQMPRPSVTPQKKTALEQVASSADRKSI